MHLKPGAREQRVCFVECIAKGFEGTRPMQGGKATASRPHSKTNGARASWGAAFGAPTESGRRLLNLLAVKTVDGDEIKWSCRDCAREDET
jgi:hypothetical protein